MGQLGLEFVVGKVVHQVSSPQKIVRLLHHHRTRFTFRAFFLSFEDKFLILKYDFFSKQSCKLSDLIKFNIPSGAEGFKNLEV